MEQPITLEQIQERLRQIDKEHFELTESLSQVSSGVQEGAHNDDDPTESEAIEQKLAGIRMKLQELEREKADLIKQLDQSAT